MTVTLLYLPDGWCSLEFDPSDIPSVASAIRHRYGVPKQEEHPIYIRYWFGGCSFVYYNEWDDPCLISNSAEGTEILKILHDTLNAATG